MAELGYYDDKLQKDQQDPNAASGSTTPQVGTGTSGVVSGSSNQAVSTAGVGAGGTGGWTNIQAYLGANKGDTGSAKNLEDKASTQYQSENSALNTQATDTKNQAQGEANKINEAKDKSKEWVSQSANAYSWDGNQNDAYKGNVNKLKSATTDQYAGPNNFAYGTSADFQRTNNALGDNKAFGSYMGDIYTQKAGGQLNSGQLALQGQLDVNNQALADTRQNLLKQYAGFGDTVNKTVTDTDAAIKKSREDYGNNQDALKSSLQNLGNEYDTGLKQAEIDARKGYNDSYTGGSGLSGTFYDRYGGGGDNALTGTVQNNSVNQLKDLGVWGSDIAWNNIQKEKEYSDAGKSMGSVAGGSLDSQKQDYGNLQRQDRMDYFNNNGYGDGWNQAKGNYDRNQSALNNFYSEQDTKYKDTGDSEKKNWNTIMDILGNTDRKQQGFNVRGA